MRENATIQEPNATLTPNHLFDLIPKMSNPEMRVTFCVARRTFGYQEQADIMNMALLIELTGMTKKTVLVGLEEAEKRGTLFQLLIGPIGQQERVVLLDTPKNREIREIYLQGLVTEREFRLMCGLKPRAKTGGGVKQGGGAKFTPVQNWGGVQNLHPPVDNSQAVANASLQADFGGGSVISTPVQNLHPPRDLDLRSLDLDLSLRSEDLRSNLLYPQAEDSSFDELPDLPDESPPWLPPPAQTPAPAPQAAKREPLPPLPQPAPVAAAVQLHPDLLAAAAALRGQPVHVRAAEAKRLGLTNHLERGAFMAASSAIAPPAPSKRAEFQAIESRVQKLRGQSDDGTPAAAPPEVQALLDMPGSEMVRTLWREKILPTALEKTQKPEAEYVDHNLAKLAAWTDTQSAQIRQTVADFLIEGGNRGVWAVKTIMTNLKRKAQIEVTGV